MRAPMGLIMVVIVMGCTSCTPKTVAQSSTTVASPSDLPISAVDFTCRLPVMTSPHGTIAYVNGFVSFPQATFNMDPTGVIRYNSDGQLVTDATPNLYGLLQAPPRAPSYDVARGRWIPASTAQISPDGAFFAYATFSASGAAPPRIHVVEVATGSDRVVELTTLPYGPYFALSVLSFEGSSIYFVPQKQADIYGTGVWRLDLSSGSVVALAPVTGVVTVHDGYAWVVRLDLRDPSPPYAGFNSIVRVNLTSGAETVWYYRPGKRLDLLDVSAAGQAIVSILSDSESEIRLVDTPGGSGSIVDGGGLGLYGPRFDGDRLWFGSLDGLYLYTASVGMRKVLAAPGSGGITVAGRCR